MPPGLRLSKPDLGHRRRAPEQSSTFHPLRLYARAVVMADELGADLLVD